jgi:DNA repair exonuclease SbcCD ATPase subunit
MDAFWEWLGSPTSALPLPTTKVTSVNENNNSTVSFDRMRNMLVRAAEIRESEQQQIFDTLDEIHARLSPLESIGAVRKRLSEIPDRTDVTALASRVEDAMAKLDSQDAALASLTRAVEGIVDKLATPFAQLDGRLDGMAGRFEGVAGRMDGLEDKLSNIHRRIDALDATIDKHLDKQDAKLDAIPGSVTGPVKERIDAAEQNIRERAETTESNLRGRIDEVDNGVRGQFDAVRGKVEGVGTQVDAARDVVRQSVAESSDKVTAKVAESSDAVQNKLAETAEGLHANVDQKSTSLSMKVEASRKALQDSIDDTKTTVDGTERLEELAVRLEQVTGRLDNMTTRLDAVEDGFQQKIADMGSTLAESLAKVEGTLTKQPDTDSVATLVNKSNEESERRIGGHLDEAMATFAELMMGGGTPPPRPPATLPRQTARRRNGKPQKGNPRDEHDDADVTS